MEHRDTSVHNRHLSQEPMPSWKLLAISGSLRARSSNGEVLKAIASLDPATVEIVLYDELALLPHFNPDDDGEGSVPPPAVARLRDRVAWADALVISSPEYAHGVPGSLKNALDWLVSGPEMVGKPVGVLTTSAWSMHAPASLVETLRTMSANVVGEAVRVVPLAGRDLDAGGILREPALLTPMRDALRALGLAANAALGA